MDWPVANIEMRPLAELKEAAANSRTHTPKQIDQIAASIEKFGWTIPVLVDEENVLIAGHARVRAGLQLGIETVPVMVATGWDEATKEAYQIADNKLAENSHWNTDILEAQIKRLSAFNFDLDVLGFDDTELDFDGMFNPTLDPTKGTTTVTGDDITKTQKNLETQFEGGGDDQTYEVTCPHCGKDFEVKL